MKPMILSAKEVGEVFDADRRGAEETGHTHGPERSLYVE